MKKTAPPVAPVVDPANDPSLQSDPAPVDPKKPPVQEQAVSVKVMAELTRELRRTNDLIEKGKFE